MFGYDISVEYRPGKLNTVADALSRRDEESVAALTLLAPAFDVFDTLRAEQATDKQVATIRKQLDDGSATSGWQIVDGLLLFKGRVFIPDESPLWHQLLAAVHYVGHEGV